MANDSWWSFLDQIVVVPFLGGISPFFTGVIVLVVLLVLGWVLKRRHERSGS
jgi:hypothetical protein